VFVPIWFGRKTALAKVKEFASERDELPRSASQRIEKFQSFAKMSTGDYWGERLKAKGGRLKGRKYTEEGGRVEKSGGSGKEGVIFRMRGVVI
jgi:hypothetical protein